MPADVNTARVKHVIALPKSLPWGEACACAAGEPHLDWHDRGGDAAAPVWLPGARSRLCRCARACCDTQCWDREPGGAARAEVLRAVALQRRHKAGLVVAQMQRRRQCSLVCLALPEHRCDADSEACRRCRRRPAGLPPEALLHARARRVRGGRGRRCGGG